MFPVSDTGFEDQDVARPSKALPSQISMLAELVRTQRERMALSQDEFLAELGFARKQYQSKVETGAIKVPDEAYLSGLSRLVKRPVAELKRLSTLQAGGRLPSGLSGLDPLVFDRDGAGEFGLFFGHCVWAAPLFLAASVGRNTSFRMVSYGSRSAPDQPYVPSSIKFVEHIAAEPSLTGDLKPYTAADVKQLMLNKKGGIHVGAMPGEVIDDDFREEFFSLGTLVDSAAGCTLVCRTADYQDWRHLLGITAPAAGAPLSSSRDPRANSRNPRSSNQTKAAQRSTATHLQTRDLGRLLGLLERRRAERGDKSPQPGRFKVGVETETVAERFLDDACGHATQLSIDDRHYRIDREKEEVLKFDLNRIAWNFRHPDLWQYRNEEAKRGAFARLEEDFARRYPEPEPGQAERPELIGVITWEPQASWLDDHQGKFTKIPLSFSPTRLVRPNHLTFELVVQRASVLPGAPRARELGQALLVLMEDLAAMGRKLNKLTPESQDPELIRRLMWYFDFEDPEETLAAVGSVRYTVGLNPSSVRLIT